MPEQPVVVAEEWCPLHLTLVAQDGVTLLVQLLRTHRHTHLDILYLPFRPRSAVHPYATVAEPFRSRLLLLVDGRQYGVGTCAVCPVRVSQVGRHVNLVRLYLLQQFLDNPYVPFRQGKFLYLATLVERQVKEVDMVFLDAVVATGVARLATTDKSLDSQHVAIVQVALLLPF